MSMFKKITYQWLSKITILLLAFTSIQAAWAGTASARLSVTSPIDTGNNATPVTWNMGSERISAYDISVNCAGSPCADVEVVLQMQAPALADVGVQSSLPTGVTASLTPDPANNLMRVKLKGPLAGGAINVGTFSFKMGFGRVLGGNIPTSFNPNAFTLITNQAGAEVFRDVVAANFVHSLNPNLSHIKAANEIAAGENNNFNFGMSLGSLTQVGRPLQGPATISYQLPLGAQPVGTAPVLKASGTGTAAFSGDVCTWPAGSSYARNTSGVEFSAVTSSTFPARTPISRSFDAATNTYSWVVPAGQELVSCSMTLAEISGQGARALFGFATGYFAVNFPATTFPVGSTPVTTFCVKGFLPSKTLGGTVDAVTPECASQTTTIRPTDLTFLVNKTPNNNSLSAGDYDRWNISWSNSPVNPAVSASPERQLLVLRDAIPSGVVPTHFLRVSTAPNPNPNRVRVRLSTDASADPSTWQVVTLNTATPLYQTLANFCNNPLFSATCAAGAAVRISELQWEWDGPISANATGGVQLVYRVDAALPVGTVITNSVQGTSTTTSGLTGISRNLNNTGPAQSATVNIVAANPLVNTNFSTSPCGINAAGNAWAGLGIGLPGSGPVVNPVVAIAIRNDLTFNGAFGTLVTGTPRLQCPGVPDVVLAKPVIETVMNFNGSGRNAVFARFSGVTIPKTCAIVGTGNETVFGINYEVPAGSAVAGNDPLFCTATMFSNPTDSATGPWTSHNMTTGGASGNALRTDGDNNADGLDTYDFNRNGSTAGFTWNTKPLTILSNPTQAVTKTLSTLTAEPGQVVTSTTTITIPAPGNDIFTAFDMVDLLPSPNDVNFDGSTRNPAGTSAAMRLTGAITSLPAGVTALYTTSSNPCRSTSAAKNPPTVGAAQVDGTPAGCTTAETNWRSADAITDWTQVTAVRFIGSGVSIYPAGHPLGAPYNISYPLQVSPAASDGQLSRVGSAGTVQLNYGTFVSNTQPNNRNFLPQFGIDTGQATTQQALEVVTASLAGRVFIDLNANGILDTGETGLAGSLVTITCTAGNCLNSPNTRFTMPTSADGSYNFMAGATNTTNGSGSAIASFPGLISGTWSISQVPPAATPAYASISRSAGTFGGVGANRSITNVVIPVGESGVNYNFGEIQSSNLILEKAWVNAPAGETVSIPATTGLSANTTAFDAVSTGSNTVRGLPVSSVSGSTVVLPTEVFAVPANAVNYVKSNWVCQDGTNAAITIPQGGSFVIPITSAGKTLTCTLTNTAVTLDTVKSATPASGQAVLQGDVISYKLATTISGGATQEALKLTDTLDAGLTVGTLPSTCSASGQTITCTLPLGTSVGTHEFAYTAKVNDKAVTQVNNQVVASMGNCSNCKTTHPLWNATTSKTSDAATKKGVRVGDKITYTISTVINGGTSTREIVLTDTIGSGLVLNEVAKGFCTAAGQVMTCTVPAGSAAGIYSFTYSANVTKSIGEFAENRVVPNIGVCTICSTKTPVFKEVNLIIQKTAKTKVAKIGEFVRYEIVIENPNGPDASQFQMIDKPAPGLSYVDGSLSVSGDAAFNVTGLNPFTISGLDLAEGQKLTLSYMMRVGASAGRGRLENCAQASDPANLVTSNRSCAEVVRQNDPDFEDTRIVGTVYEDLNLNGMQDKGEPGIPGVRLATVEGLLIETDAYGRYHIEGIDPGKWARGINFIVKVDAATLPEGTVFTSQNPLVRRLTQGIPGLYNFGVRVPYNPFSPQALKRSPTFPVILLGDGFFAFDKFELSDLQEAGRDKLTHLAGQIKNDFTQIKSIVIEGHTDRFGSDAYNIELSRKRAETIKNYLVQSGLPINAMQVKAVGEIKPIATCTGPKVPKVIACLAPNRRFEISVTGEK